MHKHYYSMTFQEPAPNGFTTSNVRIGWIENYINESRIREAKNGAKVSPNAVTLSINYLGHMTPEIMVS